ncbi:universal stress protein [Novispirillum sp. DQ9]|uniref:universal stress protein n=1 Tax=Novispirillum sp. DQ9 TaxID=3398612 RepID=UPI003C7D9D5C
MTRPILLAAVDLGPHSRAVVDRAMAHAVEHDAEVVILHCDEASDPEAGERMAALLTDLPRGRVRDVRMEVGTAVDVILREADDLDARMVVVGASDRSFLEQVFRGSVTVALTRRNRRPTLVARTAVAGPYRQALVAVDLNAPVAPVAAAVRTLLGPLVEVELFTVIDEAMRLQMIAAEAERADVEAHDEQSLREAYRVLTTAAGAVAEPGWAPRTHVVRGMPSREIGARVEALAADLLVLQPEAKGPFLRALIGSLTEDILARPLDCDVLILPAQA